LITVRLANGEIKVMSETIMRLMIEYSSSIRNIEESDDTDSDEEELKLLHEKYMDTMKKRKCWERRPRPPPTL
jgi:hypothetical protein